MLPKDLYHLKLIPYRTLAARANELPNKPGVYLFFVNGGEHLLQATSYYELERRKPISIGGMTHVYTGAARNLRERLKQHLGADIENSSLRKTLLALERAHRAITESGTPANKVKGQKSLTAWLRENALVGFQVHYDPFKRERHLLKRHASPFNIALRRNSPYARALSKWRCTVFPKNEPRQAKRLRHL